MNVQINLNRLMGRIFASREIGALQRTHVLLTVELG